MGGVRARVGFFGGTTDLGLAQRIWAKTDKARVRRRARRRPFSLGLKWEDGTDSFEKNRLGNPPGNPGNPQVTPR